MLKFTGSMIALVAAVSCASVDIAYAACANNAEQAQASPEGNGHAGYGQAKAEGNGQAGYGEAKAEGNGQAGYGEAKAEGNGHAGDASSDCK